MSRVAYAGLVVILLGLVTFGIGAAFLTKAAAQGASLAIRESRLYEDARYQVAAEESLERLYRLQPSAQVRALHRAAGLQQRADFRAASQTPALAAVLSADIRYDATVHRLFAAVDAHDLEQTLVIDTQQADPAFTVVQELTQKQARASHDRADAALLGLLDTEDLAMRLTFVVSVIGLVLLAVVILVLRHYERVIETAANAELTRFKHASLTDYLTGLGNHRAYQEDLGRAFAPGSDATSVSVALIDVDELKVINDRNGHVSGDRLLASLAGVLRTADLDSLPYRLGGDEFALALAGMSTAVAKVRMEEVRRVVEADLGATVSIGIATRSAEQPDLLLVREQADAALYEAKRRGRNRVVAFDEISGDHPMFLPARVEEVRRLIASSTPMGVAFQPIWSIDEGTLVGYEALARPGGANPINPQDAFDIAERIGKAHELDRVCRGAILAKATMLPPNAKLFLNVCPQSLDHDELSGTSLVRAVEAAGLSPQRVVLEITERSIARLDVVVREATRLRALGFQLALDDAGSGNAGLEMLSKLVVDYVKIDRDVIVRAQAGTGGRGVMAGIIAIAHEMKAHIIAEGIEDSAMLELVRGATRSSPMDIAVQGYYLGRPREEFVDGVDAAMVIPRLAGPPTPAGAAAAAP